MVKKILVTGCGGFIGGYFSRNFKSFFPHDTIVGLDDFSTGKRENVDKSVVLYEGSILNHKLLNDIFSKHCFDYIFHFAALPRVSFSIKNPSLTASVNIVGTVNLLEKARETGVKRFIFSSSSSIYGNNCQLPTSEEASFPNPESPYATQKYTSEIFCRLYSRIHGLDTVSLRYFNVYGPGQRGDAPYSTVICSWLESLYYNQRKPFIEGGGSQSRDFTFVEDAVTANIKAMEHSQTFSGDAFNIGSGSSTTLKQLKNLLENATKKHLDLEMRPPRKGDVYKTQANIKKAKRIFGYEPKFTLEQGVEKTVAWFKNRVAQEV